MEERLNAAAERLIDKLERAIDELDSYVTTVHTKEKTVEYDDEGKKPLSEKIVETEKIHIEKGLVDRAALKQLVSTLKDLRGKEDNEDDEGVSVFLSDEARELSE